MAGYEEFQVEGGELPDGEERGIAQFAAWVNINPDGETVHFHVNLAPDDEVTDASEADFPILDVNLTKAQFKSFCKYCLRMDEKL